MIVKIADNIISPLGFTTKENYANVKAGRSELHRYEGVMDIPDAFTASLMNWKNVEQRWAESGIADNDYTRFEKIVIMSVAAALHETDVDAASKRTLFVISTTKGNVELLDKRSGATDANDVLLGVTAEKIAHHFGNSNVPIVVSNACISGLCAQIYAVRALKNGRFDNAIVTGADVQSRFIVSGFQSFKALSPTECRPFDAKRCGLNLGEAAATIIYKKVETPKEGQWMALRGAIRNDANHISGPSRTGEGSYRCLTSILKDFDIERLALANVHGTSTMYNDEMESIALTRANLQQIPVNTLKGFYGHTMGAAGVLETILSMHSIDDGTILGTRGYEKCGVSNPLNISAENRSTQKRSFVKLLSGFGGCNAAMLFTKGGDE